MKSSLLLALSGVALFASCSKDQEFPEPVTPPVSPAAPAAVNPGYVRVVNVLATRPGGNVQQGSLQLEVNNQAVGPAIAVGSASPYLAVSSGEPTVYIQLPVVSGLGWVQFGKLPIAKDQRYSLFTYSSSSRQSAKVVVEPATLPAAVAGKAQLRVLNLAAEATPVRVEEATAAAPLYSEVAWGAVTSYQAVEARTYALHTSRTNYNQDHLFAQSVTLAPGKAYTLVLRGSNYSDAVAPEKLAFNLIADE